MEYIDLKLYFTKLLRNWVVIVLCCIIGVVSAFIYSEFFATPYYSSRIKIGVYNSDWTSEQANSGDIDTSLKLVKNCMVVLKDDIMAESIIEVVESETGEKYSVSQIKRALSYSQVDETQWIEVVARTTDPALSVLLCNAVAAKAPSIITDSVANIQIKNLGVAKQNNVPVSPNTTKNMMLGFVVAFVLVCFVMFVFMVFDNTVSGEDKIKQRYNLSVLGVVPNMGNTNRRNIRRR